MHLKEAVKLNQNFYSAHRNLSELIKYTLKNEHFNLLIKIYNNVKNINTNKKELAFALGKAYEDVNDFRNDLMAVDMDSDSLLLDRTEKKLKRINNSFTLFKILDVYVNNIQQLSKEEKTKSTL